MFLQYVSQDESLNRPVITYNINRNVTYRYYLARNHFTIHDIVVT